MTYKTLKNIWLLIGWVLVIGVWYLSLKPAQIQFTIDNSDKYQHVLAYMILMLWFAQLYYSNSIRKLGLMCLFILMGILIEYAQRAIGYRTFDIFDMMANSLGVLIGMLLSYTMVGNLFDNLYAKFINKNN